tara:strand:- start:10529 stop:11656 length:1128 start_codon:yes stop_codon:yes gene_type:complete
MKNRSQLKKIILFRVVPTLIIIFIALYSFNNGVMLSSNRDIESESLIVQFYYAISLFFLNGLDMGMPIGGSSLLRNALLVCYLIAPLMTAVTIIEAIVLSLNPGKLRRKLKNHIIYVGSGNLTIKEVKKMLNESIIVVVDKDPNHKNKEKLKLLVDEYIVGDIKDKSIQKRINVNESKKICLFTNKDKININAALELNHQNSIVRVEDLGMINLFKDRFQIRSVHRENAINLIESSDLLSKSNLVIFGFGRFGQNLLKELYLNEKSFLKQVTIIDSEIKRQWSSFKFLFDIDLSCEFNLIEKNQLDYSVITDINQNIIIDSNSSIIFCISHDNFNNIKIANIFRKHYKEPSIYIRSVGSAIENEISSKNNIQIFN